MGRGSSFKLPRKATNKLRGKKEKGHRRKKKFAGAKAKKPIPDRTQGVFQNRKKRGKRKEGNE